MRKIKILFQVFSPLNFLPFELLINLSTLEKISCNIVKLRLNHYQNEKLLFRCLNFLMIENFIFIYFLCKNKHNKLGNLF